MICNSSAGFLHAKRILNLNGFRIVMVQSLNGGRHELLQVEDSGGYRQFFYLVFKHTFFHSFNKYAEEYLKSNPSDKGMGESINVEFLEKAKIHSAIILYVYESGAIYMIHSIKLYKFVHLNQLIREQDRVNNYKELHDGNVLTIRKNERTAYFPITLFVRYF